MFRGWSDWVIVCLFSFLNVVGDNDCMFFCFVLVFNGVFFCKELVISIKDFICLGNFVVSCWVIYFFIEKFIKENFLGRRVIKCCIIL